MEREATLPEILDNRERRVARQQSILAQYGKSLLCFTMNIPGPVKQNFRIRYGFLLGQQQLLDLLRSMGMPVLHRETVCAVTGCEGFYVVDAPADRLKALAASLEEGSPLGRLFDMDVITCTGQKVSRQEIGLEERTCLLCGKPARICGPVRAHSAEALWTKAQALLEEAVAKNHARKIAALAVKALLYEVCTTPKPGLVDRANSGAHRDMDIFTFLGSAAVLQDYFAQCTETGVRSRDASAEETFRQIRLPGRLAEQEMYRQTGGVNTHKGAIFSMGILCAAAGRLVEDSFTDPEALLRECARMCSGVTAGDFAHVTPETAGTPGERLYAAFGITGIRGQAEAGFPAVLKHGLPVLRDGLTRGLSADQAGCAALLALIATAEDTNLIHRSNRETQQQIRQETAQLIQENPYPGERVLEQLDAEFIRRNLSPGGSADLLAMCYFLYFLESEEIDSPFEPL